MKKLPLSIVVFNLVYLVIASFLCHSRSNFEFFIYIGVVATAIAVILIINSRIPLDLTLLWLMSIWGLAHMAGGLIDVPAGWPTSGGLRVLYNWWLIPEKFKYDQLVHAYGFGMCTWLLWDIMRFSIAKRAGKSVIQIVPSFGLLFFCALGAMGLGSINEVVEFFVMLNIPEANVGDYNNTGWDMVANMTGSILVAFVLYIKRPRGVSKDS